MAGESVDEFGLIADLFAPLSRSYPGAMGLTDDAAFMPPVNGVDTVVTMDAMVAGVHFFPDDPADLIARKLVRVNLSDLAAKGAQPFALMLAVAFPIGISAQWARDFARGLAQDCQDFSVALIGGDTVSTPGPLTLSLTAFGHVPAGQGILRRGARVGDRIWVSGTIGDGALGLLAHQGRLSDPDGHLLSRYLLPRPRIGLAIPLRGVAHAAMDVSDGLVQDLGHLCAVSGVGARLMADWVPLSVAARAVAGDHMSTVLTGGDDYEILFTAPPSADTVLQQISQQADIPLTVIGQVIDGAGVAVHDRDDRPISVARTGWRHFSADS